MKLLILFLLSTAMFAQTSSSVADSATAQNPFSSGAIELSFTGGYAHTTYESTYTYLYPNPYEATSTTTFNVIDLSGSIGFYVAEGLSIEPEFQFSYFFGESSGDLIYSIIGNLSYTYLYPKSKSALFVRAGYGTANGVPVLPPNNMIYKDGSDKNSQILNLGIGSKSFLTDSILLRTEIGYTSYNYNYDKNVYGNFNYKKKYSFVKVVVGLSFLL